MGGETNASVYARGSPRGCLSSVSLSGEFCWERASKCNDVTQSLIIFSAAKQNMQCGKSRSEKVRQRAGTFISADLMGRVSQCMSHRQRDHFSARTVYHQCLSVWLILCAASVHFSRCRHDRDLQLLELITETSPRRGTPPGSRKHCGAQVRLARQPLVLVRSHQNAATCFSRLFIYPRNAKKIIPGRVKIKKGTLSFAFICP